MKLINKISLIYILNTVIVFAVGMVAIYLAVEYVVSEQVDGKLVDIAKETAVMIERGAPVENSPLVSVKETSRFEKIRPPFKDTLIYLESEKEYEDFWQYTTIKNIKYKFYRISVRTSLIEKEDLFSTIFLIMAATFALLLIVLFFVNRKSTKKIFNPFYKNLRKLEAFSLHDNKSLEPEESSIEEFKELNNSLMTLSDKALKEYNSLKEFTEDLSHELQTPVAIIKSKLELVLQKEIEDADVVGFLQAAYRNITRLDKLNRSLILLAKLETRELFISGKINLAEKVKKAAEDFSEIAQMKKIKLETTIDTGFEPEINENLLDIILVNLISNAVKHNVEEGEITLDLTGSMLTIKNTGKEPKQKPENYFERFSYDDKLENSLGLGLAITKKICALYNYKIEYTYNKPFHTITLNFK